MIGLLEAYRQEQRIKARSAELDRRAAHYRETYIALAKAGDPKITKGIADAIEARRKALPDLIVAAAKDECRFADLVHDIIADLAMNRAQADAYETEQASAGRVLHAASLGA